MRDNSRRKSTHDRAHDVRGTSVLRRPERSGEVASRSRLHMKEGRCVIMTAFEIISVIIGILSLLIAFGSLIVAFLAFLDKRNKKK